MPLVIPILLLGSPLLSEHPFLLSVRPDRGAHRSAVDSRFSLSQTLVSKQIDRLLAAKRSKRLPVLSSRTTKKPKLTFPKSNISVRVSVSNPLTLHCAGGGRQLLVGRIKNHRVGFMSDCKYLQSVVLRPVRPALTAEADDAWT